MRRPGLDDAMMRIEIFATALWLLAGLVFLAAGDPSPTASPDDA